VYCLPPPAFVRPAMPARTTKAGGPFGRVVRAGAIFVARDNVRVTTGGPSKMVLPPLAWITLPSERVRQGIEGSKRRLRPLSR
jgi:hypothetical protein